MKTDQELQTIAEAGAAWCRTPGSPDIREALPYAPTSTHADVWLIGAWCHYWTARPPRAIRHARGCRYRVDVIGCGERVVKVTAPYDHRAGVQDVYTASVVAIA